MFSSDFLSLILHFLPERSGAERRRTGETDESRAGRFDALKCRRVIHGGDTRFSVKTADSKLERFPGDGTRDVGVAPDSDIQNKRLHVPRCFRFI